MSASTRGESDVTEKVRPIAGIKALEMAAAAAMCGHSGDPCDDHLDDARLAVEATLARGIFVQRLENGEWPEWALFALAPKTITGELWRKATYQLDALEEACKA